MSELVTIEATPREGRGKGPARKLRAQGLIPVNLIGKGQSTPLQLDPKLLPKAWANGKKFNLSVNGDTKLVVIKELQVDPVKRRALHADVMVTG